MCVFRFTAGLISVVMLSFSPAAGFELEDHRVFASATPGSTLKIISTADIDAFQPIIMEYQKRHPDITVDYAIASSSELMKAIYDQGAAFDLAISSAMDLQTKIVNDGLAKTYASAQTAALPDWAKWRNQLFAFTQEPAVLVVSDAFAARHPALSNRNDLIQILRENPDRYRGRVGTYDVRRSGSGYLFATQDSRNSEGFWRLTEVMGSLDARLYCCSSEMITDVATGRLALAHNVLGSYAASRLLDTPGISIIQLDDFVTVMLRTALIPATAQNDRAAQTMIDFLTTLKAHPDLTERTRLPPIDEAALQSNTALRPIRLGPGLLVFLDRLRREKFLESWENSIVQQ